MTDYELEYQRNEVVCGDPFPEFVELFEALPSASTVLDLGAGQGRDTLVAARLGHKVVAVDISPTGIGQILVAAQRENLSVEGVVTDLTDYCPYARYDVVVLDRIVHMLKNTKDKVALLSKAAQATAESGYALVADTPSNQEHIERQFGDRKAWMRIAARKGRWIFKRVTGAT
ncbi:MAG: class I SAM-dependent methyltransferase [Lysobacterales bacterium]|jgi:SAM-dependent methyltransferase